MVNAPLRVGVGGGWETSVPLAQFCYESKTARKNSLLNFLTSFFKEPQGIPLDGCLRFFNC